MDELDKIIITDDVKAQLRLEQNRLIKIIEAFVKLDNNKDWQTVKELVFDTSLQAIERQIFVESLTPTIKTDKLYNLQGQWAWAKQYSDVNRFVDNLKKQLEEIKRKLK
jgi:hypothetical protein